MAKGSLDLTDDATKLALNIVALLARMNLSCVGGQVVNL